jgi:hypothetical protein
VPTSLQQCLELFNQDISSFDQALALVALGSKKYEISKSLLLVFNRFQIIMP